MSSPSEEFDEEEDPITRRCTSFGEAAIIIANDSITFGKTDFFKCFYNGFTENSTIWFAYHDDNKEYENPFKFSLDSWKDEDGTTNIMREIISPRILPANFTSGKSAIGYEFCYPSVAARQLGFVQVPPLFYFADMVQARNPISTALTYNRLKSLEPVIDMTQLADWQIAPLTTIPFVQWWSEWQDDLFCGSLKVYCITLDENYQSADDEVNTENFLAVFHFASLLCILTNPLNRLMALHPQQSAEADSRSDILHQPITLSSAIMCQILLICCWQEAQNDQH